MAVTDIFAPHLDTRYITRNTSDFNVDAIFFMHKILQPLGFEPMPTSSSAIALTNQL
jgi:hypothetical protein